MPTYETTRRFDRDFAALSADQKAAFREAVAKFVGDIESGIFRKGLRVKRIQGTKGVYEMTWSMGELDGRATFMYGPPQLRDEPHIIWRRCGSHRIFDEP